jgi:hypothetical protein
MLVFMLVWLLLIFCCVYAAMMGGTTGKIGAALIVVATIATAIAQHFGHWTETNLPVLVIDLIVLAALYALALKSEVYWPIWAVGFHLISVTGHVATMIMPDFRSSVYYMFNGMWAIFIQVAMVWGITLDRFFMPDDRRPNQPAA